MSKTRIAIVTSTYPPKSGGVASAHYNLFRAFSNKGYETMVFSFLDNQKEKSSEIDEFSIRKGTPRPVVFLINALSYLYFDIIRKDKLAYQYAENFKSAIGAYKLNSYLRLFNPDVLIVPDHGAPLYFIEKPKNCITIWFSHHNPLRFVGNPLIGDFSLKDAELALKMENKALKKADIVFCPSNYMKDVFEKTYDAKIPVYVIPNIVDDKTIAEIIPANLHKQIGCDNSTQIIYIPSAGTVAKGVKFVPEIIKRFSDVQQQLAFYLSGYIPESLKIELSHYYEKVKFYMPGHVSWRENIANIKSCSFTISPTLIDNLSMAILEACFCGLPLVTFDTGGNSDIVENGINGYIVDYLNIDALIEKSNILLEKGKREKMGYSSLEIAKKKFSTPVTIKKIEEILLQCYK